MCRTPFLEKHSSHTGSAKAGSRGGRPEDMHGGHLKVNETVRASLGRARRIPATAPAEVQACTAGALRRNAVSTEAVRKMKYSGQDFRPKGLKAHGATPARVSFHSLFFFGCSVPL